jgi:hypothetical protein
MSTSPKWSSVEDEILILAWNAGKRAFEIAAEMPRRNEFAIGGRLKRLRDKGIELRERTREEKAEANADRIKKAQAGRARTGNMGGVRPRIPHPVWEGPRFTDDPRARLDPGSPLKLGNAPLTYSSTGCSAARAAFG